MKKNCWFVLGAMLSTSLLAQPVTNAPPAPPMSPTPAAAVTNTATGSAAGETNAPATKPAKKKKAAAKKSSKKAEKKTPAKAASASELATVPLVAGPAVVVASNVNVRGQAKLKSEVVTKVTKDQPVTVLEEIVRNNSAPDEPSAWAKILLPANAHVWVSSQYVDATNKTVVPNKLNVRSGPGENYSILGQMERGEPVKELATKNGWIEIEAPTNAYAFVAAQFLKQVKEIPATLTTPAEPTPAPTTPAEPTPAPTTLAEAPAVAAAPTEAPVVTNAPAEIPALTNAPAETATTNEAPAMVEEPPPPRIVQREGVVRGTVSIQAPTHFALVSPDNGRLIDYLDTTSPNLDLRRYKGLRIIVTGEEGLDERWGNTPVLTIQKIQVLE